MSFGTFVNLSKSSGNTPPPACIYSIVFDSNCSSLLIAKSAEGMPVIFDHLIIVTWEISRLPESQLDNIAGGHPNSRDAAFCERVPIHFRISTLSFLESMISKMLYFFENINA
jgi:hypothetical protein